MNLNFLDFEKPILEIDSQIRSLTLLMHQDMRSKVIDYEKEICYLKKKVMN